MAWPAFAAMGPYERLAAQAGALFFDLGLWPTLPVDTPETWTLHCPVDPAITMVTDRSASDFPVRCHT